MKHEAAQAGWLEANYNYGYYHKSESHYRLIIASLGLITITQMMSIMIIQTHSFHFHSLSLHTAKCLVFLRF